MPIFGLVWMASWVGCFVSSSSVRLLETPSYLANILLRPARAATISDRLGATTPLTRFSANSVQASLLSAAVAVNSQPHVYGPITQLPLSQVSVESHWFDPIAALFVRPSSTPPLAFTAALINSLNRQPENPNPIDYFLGAFKSALGGLQNLVFTETVNSPLVVVVPAAPTASSREQKGISSCLHSLKVGTKATHPERFQIWVQGCLVAELPSHEQAQAVAARLTAGLRAGGVPPQLHPTKISDMPAGMLGDRILFIIDPIMAAQLDDSAELAAIEWINNLRIALRAQPFPLAEAQVIMHQLANTGDSIAGIASWYGPYFHGRQTATGEIFDQEDLTAAHPSLPFDTYLKVTNLKNGQSVVVRVNDRGPYFDNRVLDLSHRAARCIGGDDQGVVPIKASIMLIDPTLETKQTQTVARI